MKDSMRDSESLEPNLSVRTLKIEETGDFWKGLIKPKIRLMGRWLEQAGFKAGNRVSVTFIAPGVIELRSTLTDTNESSLDLSNNPF